MQEEDGAAGELARLLLGGDVAEAHECRLVAAEPVFLHEERHEDTIDLENEIVGLSTVENIVGEMEQHLAFHAVWLADAANLEDVFLSNH